MCTLSICSPNGSDTFQHGPYSRIGCLLQVAALLTPSVPFNESDSFLFHDDHVHRLHEFPFYCLNVGVSHGPEIPLNSIYS